MKNKPREIIIGSDWWTDCDDCMAMRIAAHFHMQGKIKILGVGINACMEYSVRSLDAFLRHEGLFDVPIGVDFEATDYGGKCKYQKGLAERFESRYEKNEDCPDALSLYRKCLAEAEGPVDIVELGFTQVLAALLESEGDAYSPLSGQELVRQKVGRFWDMGGKYDVQGSSEYNFSNKTRARVAAHKVCNDWPTPITFLGHEVSEHIQCGAFLPTTDALGQAMFDHGSHAGRSSWDPMLTLLACIGNEAEAGYDTVAGHVSVDPQTGCIYFEADETSSRRYVVKQHDDDYYRRAVDEILLANVKQQG